MKILAPLSVGDVLDRLSILALKRARLTDPAQRANVETEHAALSAAAIDVTGLDDLRAALDEVNGALWDVEDDLRRCEAAGDFGEAFVALARSVYRLNDRRAAIKREINLASGSVLIEEKSYGNE